MSKCPSPARRIDALGSADTLISSVDSVESGRRMRFSGKVCKFNQRDRPRVYLRGELGTGETGCRSDRVGRWQTGGRRSSAAVVSDNNNNRDGGHGGRNERRRPASGDNGRDGYGMGWDVSGGRGQAGRQAGRALSMGTHGMKTA